MFCVGVDKWYFLNYINNVCKVVARLLKLLYKIQTLTTNNYNLVSPFHLLDELQYLAFCLYSRHRQKNEYLPFLT